MPPSVSKNPKKWRKDLWVSIGVSKAYGPHIPRGGRCKAPLLQAGKKGKTRRTCGVLEAPSLSGGFQRPAPITATQMGTAQ
jgi:hypothetical protein